MPPPLDPAPARPRAGTATVSRNEMWSGMDHGSIMGAEMMVGVLLLTGIGYLVDGWLGTDPWFLVIGGMLGFAAGLYLVFLRSGRMEAAERARMDALRSARRGGDDGC